MSQLVLMINKNSGMSMMECKNLLINRRAKKSVIKTTMKKIKKMVTSGMALNRRGTEVVGQMILAYSVDTKDFPEEVVLRDNFTSAEKVELYFCIKSVSNTNDVETFIQSHSLLIPLKRRTIKNTLDILTKKEDWC